MKMNEQKKKKLNFQKNLTSLKKNKKCNPKKRYQCDFFNFFFNFFYHGYRSSV
jgi:hypothetical protein